MEHQELRRLAKAAARRPLWVPGPSDAVAIGRDEIERLIPHRDPFLFVERVTGVSLAQQCIRAERRIDPGDPVFKGHFPGHPVYPGVLQLETIGQAGLCLISLVKAETRPANIRAVRVHYAEFLAPVEAGDKVLILCRVVSLDEYTGIFAGQLLKGDAICSFGISEVYFVDE